MIAGTAPAAGLAATEAVLLGWLENARPGQRLLYHVGNLAVDRYPGDSPLPSPLRLELVRLADRVMALAAEGRVLPVQKRLDDRRTAYLAIRTRASAHDIERAGPARRGENNQGGFR